MTTPFDEALRPRAPRHPEATVTAVGRHGQQTLVAIHGHLRQEMAQVVRAVTDALADEGRAADARALINDASMTVNYRALGSFCGRYCQVVAVHHRIEDQAMFVDLAGADPELRPVLDRLSEEHDLIHETLVGLDSALVAMIEQEPGALARVTSAVTELQAGLLSHLDYEEAELLGPIGRLGIYI